ncbi:MAG: hypothetical protein ACFFD4_38660 [Candidatus Odinarchaeota archaeon]
MWTDLLLQTIVLVIQASMFIMMGVVFFRPADNLRKIAKTEGKDITELMKALKDLSLGFLVLFLLVLVMIAMDVAYILLSL